MVGRGSFHFGFGLIFRGQRQTVCFREGVWHLFLADFELWTLRQTNRSSLTAKNNFSQEMISDYIRHWMYPIAILDLLECISIYNFCIYICIYIHFEVYIQWLFFLYDWLIDCDRWIWFVLPDLSFIWEAAVKWNSCLWVEFITHLICLFSEICNQTYFNLHNFESNTGT